MPVLQRWQLAGFSQIMRPGVQSRSQQVVGGARIRYEPVVHHPSLIQGWRKRTRLTARVSHPSEKTASRSGLRPELWS